MTVPKKKWMVVGPMLVSLLPFVACASSRYDRSDRYGGYDQRRVVYIEVAPPEPVVEVISVSPGAGYVWIPGHHRWDRDRYVWVGGSWRAAPPGRTLWIAGRWEQSPRGWFWVAGRWS